MGKIKFSAKGKPTSNAAHQDVLSHGLVVASHGRHFVARDEDGKLWQLFGKGKRREVAVGDEVSIRPSGDEQAWVEEILPRRNLVYRSDALKSKLFAANLDQVVLVLAVSPPYSTELLGRTLVACQHAGVPLHVVFNKVDLFDDVQEAMVEFTHELNEWTRGECPIHFVSLTEAPKDAQAHMLSLLEHKRTLILGQSGMGKSTLINLLIPEARASTNEISMALNAGKHTTTHTQMHFGESGLELIDSPGFQAFGLFHLTEDELLDAFPDISKPGMRCRFANCQHLREPDCAVKLALEGGDLSEARFELFMLLREELRSGRGYE
ncbi:MAG TPA: ribosome small subunit-dependent GTPase A [Limnobacter sp.]|uniref:ribosome small subunit-dependent GTPase A n=1 Tax=Limnobacter sp. TaxID=2003368 RepID=UPI002ED80ABF